MVLPPLELFSLRRELPSCRAALSVFGHLRWGRRRLRASPRRRQAHGTPWACLVKRRGLKLHAAEGLFPSTLATLLLSNGSSIPCQRRGAPEDSPGTEAEGWDP